jgi:hypothetical protein
MQDKHNLLSANKFSENLAKFSYFGTAATNQHLIHEEVGAD